MIKSSHEALPYRKCVGMMVLNNEGKVWAGHRLTIDNDEFPANSEKRWQMPQGGIDKGESPLAAAKRELWEETGITDATLLAEAPEWINYNLPEALVGKALKGKYRGQTQKWFAFRFRGDEKEINIVNPPNGAAVEFDQWQWLDMDQLVRCVVDFKYAAYVQVITTFEHLAR